jgi:hypothetical protein
VKPAGISGGGGGEYLKNKINELATNSENKNITDTEEEMNLRRVTNLEPTSERMRLVICLQIPTTV